MSVVASESSKNPIPTGVGSMFLTTSVGKKIVMACSGLVWAGFVFVHMAGNLLLFVSKDAYNSYAHLVSSGGVAKIVETILVASLLSHILCGLKLTLENRRARGVRGYQVSLRGNKAGSFASRSMAVSGLLVLVFLISHLATFKYGQYYETTVNGVVMRDLFRLVNEIFIQPGFLFWYVICLLLLGAHLSHGIGSTIQSLGLRGGFLEPWVKRISWIYALVVAGGFLSQPIYVFLFAR